MSTYIVVSTDPGKPRHWSEIEEELNRFASRGYHVVGVTGPHIVMEYVLEKKPCPYTPPCALCVGRK